MMKREDGFTLVEILAVVVLLAVFMPMLGLLGAIDGAAGL